MKRRDFLSIAAGTTAGISAMSFFPFQVANAKGMHSEGANSDLMDYDRTGWGACPVDCGCRCPIQVNVKDGRIKFVEPDNVTDDKELGKTTQIRACVRGRSTKYRVYNPLRLKRPLKRVGKRGEGRYVEISWDEAFTIIAREFKKIGEKYGGEAFYLSHGTGVLGGTVTASWHPSQSVVARLLNCYKGFTKFYNDYSVAKMEANGALMMGHGWVGPSSVAQIENTDLLVSFGESFSETSLSGGSNGWYITNFLERAKANKKTKFMLIDPRYTDTAVGKADVWVPVRPGTDAAFIAGMLYTMNKEGLVDKAFLDKYTVGWDESSLPSSAPKHSSYVAYLDGSGWDKVKKTPEWAAKICGIPAKQIVEYAHQIAAAKSAFFCQGWGPQRHSNGDEISRAIELLAVATGNLGKIGTSTGARTHSDGSYPIKRMPVGTNPVKQTMPFFLWTDAMSHDKWQHMTAKNAGIRGSDTGKLKSQIKCMISYGANPLSHHANINNTVEVLKDMKNLDFILDINVQKSVSCNYADIILPDATPFEHVDIMRPYAAGTMAYVILTQQAIKPVFDTMPVYDMMAGIAEKMGFKDKFTEGKSQEDWVKELWADSKIAMEKAGYKNVPSYAELKAKGVHRELSLKAGQIQFKDFIEDPVGHPVNTPSGKIEIYSTRAAEMNTKFTFQKGYSISPIPMHVARFNSYVPGHTPKKYPLQMHSFHSKDQVHSTYYENDVLRELHPHKLWMNPNDAFERGLEQGDRVMVHNEFGAFEIPVLLTNRMRPGVVCAKDGAWYRPDERGICQGGAVNMVTSNEPVPLVFSNGQGSNFVQVEKVTATTYKHVVSNSKHSRRRKSRHHR